MKKLFIIVDDEEFVLRFCLTKQTVVNVLNEIVDQIKCSIIYGRVAERCVLAIEVPGSTHRKQMR